MTLSLKTTLMDPGRVLVVLSGTGGTLDTGLEDSREALNMTTLDTRTGQWRWTRHTHTPNKWGLWMVMGTWEKTQGHLRLCLLRVVLVLPMGQRVSGGLQVNWGCEGWEGRLPRLMTNRNVMLVLEGRTGLKRVELNVTRAKPAHWLQICLCVCYVKSLTGWRLGSGLAWELKKKKKGKR